MKVGLSYSQSRLWNVFRRYPTTPQCRFNSKFLSDEERVPLGPTLQEEHRTVRLRKDAKPLPLPPLLDPVVRSKRARWEQLKARPHGGKRTPFQHRLHENPYAHALASPVRHCAATTVVLPQDFLVTFRPVEHPETGGIWMLPTDPSSRERSSYHSRQPPIRMANNLFILEWCKEYKWKTLIAPRFRQNMGDADKRMVWREDLVQLVLSRFQQPIIQKLRYFFERPGGQLVQCGSPLTSDIEATGLDDVSCVLYLGSLKTPADKIQAKSIDIMVAVDQLIYGFKKKHTALVDPHTKANHNSPAWYKGPLLPTLLPRLRYPPLEFKTTRWRDQEVSVYSLPDLLGEENTKELVMGTQFEDAGCIVMRRRRNNTATQLLLMQLQGFLATPGP